MAHRSLVERLRSWVRWPTSRHRRFHPLQIGLVILVAGWLPLILTLFLSYSSLRETLERRLIVDRRTLVNSLSSLIGYDLVRTSEVMRHYQTLPATTSMVSETPGDRRVQDWLAAIYYGQPRIDGMFLADKEGRIVAALPRDEAMIGAPYPAESQLGAAPGREGAVISPIHHRAPDNRMVTAIIAPVRGPGGELLGYIGSQILVERLGRRLMEYNFGEESHAQVLDQTGVPLFEKDFQPRNSLVPAASPLVQLLREDTDGIFNYNGELYTSFEIEETNWVALLRQPVEVAYRPLRQFVKKGTFLALWMLGGTALVALAISRIYARQLSANERVEREMLFSEIILSSMPIGVGVFDPTDGRLVKINAQLRDMAGKFGQAEGPAKHFTDLGFTTPEMFEKTVNHRQPFIVSERQVEDQIGQQHFLSLTVFPMEGPRETLQGVLLVAVDTTGEASVRRELMAANVAKDQFLAALSHELRNPLSPIVTMVDELEERTGSDPENRAALEVIRRNVSLEARLIDDLLDVTRIAHNKLKLTLEMVDAHEVIESALQICRQDADDKDIKLEQQFEASRFQLRADPARLNQVFWNLIKNAVKFTPAGGRITVRTWNEGPYFVSEVRDTGAGIALDRLDSIFERFEQGGAAVTRQFGGLGLGLAISKAMVEAHGGSIRAESDGLGTGARFVIRLNYTVSESASSRSIVPAVEPDTGPASRPVVVKSGHRILLVDDHPDTLRGMQRLLERRGFSVVTAGSLGEAREVAAREDFDLLISDLGLPDGSGLELMEGLRSERPDLIGIAISGYGMESDRAKTRQAGFSEHLIKPVDLAQLTEALRRLLG